MQGLHRSGVVDTDLTWDGDEFIRLCSHPVDVVGGAYPYKDDSGDIPAALAADGLMEENGLWKCRPLRRAFAHQPPDTGEDRPRAAVARVQGPRQQEGQRSWMFFDNLQRPSGIYDEGYIFCEHWRQVGGTVWLDPDLNLTHIGRKPTTTAPSGSGWKRRARRFEKLVSEFPAFRRSF
jgi:hypothetical protein